MPFVGTPGFTLNPGGESGTAGVATFLWSPLADKPQVLGLPRTVAVAANGRNSLAPVEVQRLRGIYIAAQANAEGTIPQVRLEFNQRPAVIVPFFGSTYIPIVGNYWDGSFRRIDIFNSDPVVPVDVTITEVY